MGGTLNIQATPEVQAVIKAFDADPVWMAETILSLRAELAESEREIYGLLG